MRSGPQNGYEHRKKMYDALKADGAPLQDTYEQFRDAYFTKKIKVSKTAVVSSGAIPKTTGAKSKRNVQVVKDGKGNITAMLEENGNPLPRGKMYTYTDPKTGKVTKYVTPEAEPTSAKPAKGQKPYKLSASQMAAAQNMAEQFAQSSERLLDETKQRVDDIGEYGKGLKTSANSSVKSGNTYLTPFGERMSSKAMADLATQQYNEAVDMTVGGQLRRAERELNDLRSKAEGRRSALLAQWEKKYKEEYEAAKKEGLWSEFKWHVSDMMQSGSHPYMSQANVQIESDAQYRNWQSAIRKKEEQIKTLRDQYDRDRGIDVGFWRGFGDTVKDIRTWDFGYHDIMDAATRHEAVSGKNRKKSASVKAAEQDMLKAIYDNQQAEEAYGGNASWRNRAGVMGGYMPSFAIDLGLTGGLTDAIKIFSKAATKGAVKAIGKKATQEMAEMGFKKYVTKYGAMGLGREAANWTIKALGTTADDIVRGFVVANTIQAAKTGAATIEKKLGDVKQDSEGRYDFENKETWANAIWQTQASNTIENFSEMFGGHLDKVSWGKIAEVFGAKKISGVLTRLSASEFGKALDTTRELFKRFGISGYFGEVAEEYYGQLWRTVLNLDDACQMNPDGTRTNLFNTEQFQVDVWCGMALSMGLMSAGKVAISAAGYAHGKHQVNMADKRASKILAPEIWEPMRLMIDNAKNEEIPGIAKMTMEDKGLTKQEKAAVMDYMERSLAMRGYNLADMAKQRTEEQKPDEQSLNQSYQNGYNVHTPQEMTDVKNAYEYQ